MADGLSYVAFAAGPGLAEQITAHVERQIVQGALKSDERIQESRICKELGVSRGSVREAFRLLERKRLIRLVPRRGALVSKLCPSRVSDVSALVQLLITPVAGDMALGWNAAKAERLDHALLDSKTCYGAVSPISAFQLLCRLHPNAAFAETLDDLAPTFHRLFAKLVRLDPRRVSGLEDSVLHELKPALESRSSEVSQRVALSLCRQLERKYLETLERTG